MTLNEDSPATEATTKTAAGNLEPECSRVLDDIWAFLDDEMDPAARQQMRAHLDNCSPCLDESDIGEKLKALLHRKCGGEVAPEVLRERLILALHQRL